MCLEAVGLRRWRRWGCEGGGGRWQHSSSREHACMQQHCGHSPRVEGAECQTSAHNLNSVVCSMLDSIVHLQPPGGGCASTTFSAVSALRTIGLGCSWAK